MKFHIEASCGKARAGILSTDHGEVPTPAFMPVGTLGAVKTLESREVRTLGASIILGNAYHLYLRPGTEVLKQFGGLHRFMSWDGPILSDSGGYQVLSLAERRRVTEEGVTFSSHLDGSRHLFTPEKVIEIQRAIGADIIMPLDELVGWPAEWSEADLAAQRTWNWLKRSLQACEEMPSRYGYEQILPPIVQGSFYPELRIREAERLRDFEAPMYAIGGLSVGEAPQLTREAIDIVREILPPEKPIYCMGIGLPGDLLDAIGRGIDLFDCVVPTRNGRNATLFTAQGRLNIRNTRFAADRDPVEEGCDCLLCSQYSRAYLHHLFRSKEILGLKLASAHNLRFYFRLMKMAREHIRRGDYDSWVTSFLGGVRRTG